MRKSLDGGIVEMSEEMEAPEDGKMEMEIREEAWQSEPTPATVTPPLEEDVHVALGLRDIINELRLRLASDNNQLSLPFFFNA